MFNQMEQTEVNEWALYAPCTTAIFSLLCTTNVGNKYIVLKVNTATKIPCFFEYVELAVSNQMH